MIFSNYREIVTWEEGKKLNGNGTSSRQRPGRECCGNGASFSLRLEKPLTVVKPRPNTATA